MNNVVFRPPLSSGVGVAVMLGSTELVEVMLTELAELIGLEVVESNSVSLPSVVLELGAAVVPVLRLGMLDDVTAVVGPSSLLTPT